MAMIYRTTTCTACGEEFQIGARGPVPARCPACMSGAREFTTTCARCGQVFTWPGRGRVPTACEDCRQRCAVDDCDKRPQRMTGLCAAHYRRMQKGADLTAPIRQWETGERLCKVGGCGEQRITRSATYCRTHYQEYVYQAYSWAWRYGLTPEAYEALLAAQNGRCAICGTDDPKGGNRALAWTVDHDHDCCSGTKSCGKCIRALLCAPCNRGIGQFGDDPDVVEAAAAYLRSYARARLSIVSEEEG